ncbi:DUF21/CBS domain protein [Natronomonas moolapensis 8.8.11]|uniref:DUF21/CBS domain protein n=1 Tax=Natronomonas moolapensis (strain DSM 18674 / CECT 7526 / JCM 14361 / 8.8.11) TaxID=268739 RepID=M1XQB2_NATM8|nr:hemolysin family protein [Natronomonas moolapensis]CCQ36270.1 DUF21/CBS domain protein [Natronomonas moolapensis 8.8.11]
MVDVALSATRLLVALLLVVLNGFFVASEFAFVRIRATSVEQLVEEGRAGADVLSSVVGSLDDYLAVTQLGITIASLGLGWVGEPAVAALIEPLLSSVLPPSLLHLAAFAIGFGFITFLHVVFGELAPKTLAIAEAERISLLVAPPMKLFYYLFYPGLVVFNGTANAFTRLLGVPPASETDETLGEREIRRVLARAGEAGRVDPGEIEMIEGVFELDDTDVRSVMVPRPDVVSLRPDASLSEIKRAVLDAGHTRYPVVSDDGDRVVGFVDLKDVLRASEADSQGDATAGTLAREVAIVPETTSIGDLLLQFRDDSGQMAAVVDEWGTFEGIATVEDVVEAIVGDLRDEFDADRGEPSIRGQPDGSYEVDGSVAVSVVNETLGASFEAPDVETIGGLVFDLLGRAPEAGDSVEIDGHVLEVRGVDGARIEAVHVSTASTDPDEGDTTPDGESGTTSGGETPNDEQ